MAWREDDGGKFLDGIRSPGTSVGTIQVLMEGTQPVEVSASVWKHLGSLKVMRVEALVSLIYPTSSRQRSSKMSSRASIAYVVA